MKDLSHLPSGAGSLQGDRTSPTTADPEAIPFDQQQRYRLIGELLGSLRGDGPPLTILDVGGRTGVLRRYVAPDDRVVLADTESSTQHDLVLATGTCLPFPDGTFDAVVAADTLEHVPGPVREAFVRESCRVTRKWTVLAGPYQHPRVEEAEVRLAEFVRLRLKTPHRYLEEHRALGLPDRDKVERWCREGGAHTVRALGHGNLERWLGLMAVALLLDDDPATREPAARLHRFYNEALLPSDHAGRVYRHMVVAIKDGPLPAAAEELLAPADLPPAMGGPVTHMLEQLLSFDMARDVLVRERERLEVEIKHRERDLVGHASSLLEARRDLQQHIQSLLTAKSDLEGHAQTLATVRHNLVGHKQALETAHEDLAGHAQALSTARADLDGHKAKLEETLADLDHHRGVVAEQARSIEAYAAEAEALRAELEGAQSSARSIQAELLRKTRWRRKVFAWVNRVKGKR
jgi:Methyltransferase domain